MPNFHSLNIISSGSLRLFSGISEYKSNTGFITSVTDNGLIFSEANGTDPLLPIVQISSSNKEARFGIGFPSGQKFEKTFDLLSTKDSTVGTEILLRSRRTSTGAQPGDIAGKINFAVQSGSYKSVETSGSAGSIRARVDVIDEAGVIGSLILGTPASKYLDQDTLTVNYFKSTFSSSLEVLNNISSTGTVQANQLSASDATINGQLYLNSPPILPLNNNLSDYGVEFQGGDGQTAVDNRFTYIRETFFGEPIPDGFRILSLTGSFNHSGSYELTNGVLSIPGFPDVSSSLSLIDCGVF